MCVGDEEMKSKMLLANLLSESIFAFVDLIDRSRNQNIGFQLNQDKVFQLHLFIKEYKFQETADELERINRFCWNGSYTIWLAEDLMKGLEVVEEYVERNYGELFLFKARLHTMKDFCLCICAKDIFL